MTEAPASKAPVAIIAGGGANIASLRFALERLGRESVLTTDPDTIRSAGHVILPGVGAARAAMERLSASGLDRLIPTLKQSVLGSCLGMQLLFDASEEDDARCLGIIPGVARRFDPAPDRPVPHMGWNQVDRVADNALLTGIQFQLGTVISEGDKRCQIFYKGPRGSSPEIICYRLCRIQTGGFK